MRKEALDRANEIQAAIDQYDKLAFIVTNPYVKVKLHKKLLHLAAYNDSTEVIIADPDLAAVIADYCKTKRSKLLSEFGML